MVKLDKIYTRGGDKGFTSLTHGSRVSKNHPRVDTFGTVDEANSTIGIARLHADKTTDSILSDIQQDLFDLGADLSTPFQQISKKTNLRIDSTQVKRLEEVIDLFNKDLEPLKSFVLPGGSPCSAYLHLARTIVRRSERHFVHSMNEEQMNPLCLEYLNRLSDLLFVLARHCNEKGKKDVLWHPGKNKSTPI